VRPSCTRLREPSILNRRHFNDHIDEPGDFVFRHACKLGFEGIVSKRLGSPYLSGCSRYWIKSKNTTSPAVNSLSSGEEFDDRQIEQRSPLPGCPIYRPALV